MKDLYNHPIAMETLFSKKEVLQLLKLKGAFDSTLDFVRERYTDRFGLPLIWKVPISDDMRGGGTIVPVREGVLYLPYRTVYETQGARYILKDSELLSQDALAKLMQEVQAYLTDLHTFLLEASKTKSGAST